MVFLNNLNGMTLFIKKSFNDIDSFTACYPIKLFAGKWSGIFKLI